MYMDLIITDNIDEIETNNLSENEDLTNIQQNLFTMMSNTYICAICQTNYLSLEENRKHIETSEHIHNRHNCETLIKPYIFNLYPKDETWINLKKKYFINENYDYDHDDLHFLKICQREKNRSFNLNNAIDKKEYFNWKLDKILNEIETIQENKKNIPNNLISENRILNNNFNEVNFISEQVNLDEIKCLLMSKPINLISHEKNNDLIFKQIELFENNINTLTSVYNDEYDIIRNLLNSYRIRKEDVEKANFTSSILVEVLYILFKNILSYDVLVVNNTFKTNYIHVNNLKNNDIKFVWVYKNSNEEFSIIEERDLKRKFEIILLNLQSKLGLSDDYNYYEYFKNTSQRLHNINKNRNILNILRGLFLLNNLT